MVTNLEKELMAKSLKIFGVNGQLIKLSEEASELSVASLHLNNPTRRDNPEKKWREFIGEIADVEFLIDEMKFFFPKLAPNVAFVRKEKVMKLDKLLNSLEKEKEVPKSSLHNQITEILDYHDEYKDNVAIQKIRKVLANNESNKI